MTAQNGKLETLRKREAEIKAQIAAMQAKEKSKSRKEDTRCKVIIGAAIMADTVKHPDTRAGIVDVLKRAVVAPKDVEFLKAKGWL